jgi:hypothetical protein
MLVKSRKLEPGERGLFLENLGQLSGFHRLSHQNTSQVEYAGSIGEIVR